MSRRDQQIAEGLTKIAERLSEAIANARAPHGEVATVDDLLAVNDLVWELRWEVGPFDGETDLPAAGSEAAQ